MKQKDNAERQAKRRQALNDVAKELGFASWGKFETAVINDKVYITVVKVTKPEDQ